ncbi:MAG: dipeptidase E, partial [Clostridium sp.]|nr:dipeptidase E [Clostridium sp.]
RILDGKRLFEDITYPDSLGREFYVLPDGSYIYSRDGEEEILGEAWRIADGKLEKISQAN